MASTRFCLILSRAQTSRRNREKRNFEQRRRWGWENVILLVRCLSRALRINQHTHTHTHTHAFLSAATTRTTRTITMATRAAPLVRRSAVAVRKYSSSAVKAGGSGYSPPLAPFARIPRSNEDVSIPTQTHTYTHGDRDTDCHNEGDGARPMEL